MATAADSTMKPVEHIAGRPVYKHGTAPAHLRSRSQLYTGLRLTLGPGQQPVCWVIPYFHPDERCALYDPASAVPVADQRIGSIWAWRARRTCPKCGEVREYVVHGRQCGKCWRTEQAALTAKAERRCDGCKRIGAKPYPKTRDGWAYKRLCRACRSEFNRKLDAALTEASVCPGGCGKRTAAKKQILAWALEHRYSVTRWQARYCPPCNEVRQAEVAEREAIQRAKWAQARAEQQAREEAERARRRQELDDLRTWAIEVLADPNTVILDTETTGLHDTARIVDIAVITATGETLIDTLINPGEPIPAEASSIHGITDDMVADAPSFGEILADLEKAFAGKRVLVYNVEYDTARIQHEMEIHLGGAHPGQRVFDYTEVQPAAAWMAKYDWEDAMEPYSAWYGDWNDYYGNYRWQRLGGGHRAHGDCLAVIECLKAMARPSVYEEDENV